MPARLIREAIVEALIAEGVKHVFGLPGGQMVFTFNDALYDCRDQITSIMARDERSASFMACGYAQMSRGPALCYGTLGPGFANLIPGMGEAYRGSWPVIFLSCSTPRLTAGHGSMQEIPQMQMVAPITKWSWHLEIPDQVYWMMRQAFSEACSYPPGPVYIEIPTDMGNAVVEGLEYQKSYRVQDFEPSDEAVAAAVDLLLAAEKPVIIAGGGVHMAQAWAELQELAELVGAPVGTTCTGKAAISETHPLAIGVVGNEGTRFTNEYVEDADLVFWVGSAMEDLETSVYTRGRGRGKLICANVNPTHINRVWVPDVALMGHARLTLRKLVRELKRRDDRHPEFLERPRVKELLALKESWEKKIEEEVRSLNSSPLHPARIAREIDRLKPDNLVLAADSAFNSFWFQGYPYFKILKPGNSIAKSQFSFIGFAAAAAIGAKLATEDPVMAVCGDGGFHFVMPELATAAQYRIPVVFVVMDNKSIGWIKYWQQVVHEERYLDTDFVPPIDFTTIARACSCKALAVERPEEIADAMQEAFRITAAGEPVLVHAHVDWSARWWGSDDVVKVYTEGRVPRPV
ncbi:MAG: thiamine pyrophosphate-binding protein [Moorellales bacterium]